MKFSKFFVFLLVLFVIAAVIYYFTTPSSNQIKLTGIVTGNEVIASPQVTGRLVKLNVDEGSVVKAGELIGELDPAELEAARDAAADNTRTLEARLTQSTTTRSLDDAQTAAALRQAEANVTAVTAQLAQARSTLSLDDTTYKREQGLLDKGVVAQQDRDNAYTAFLVAQDNVKALEDQVRAAQAQVSVAQANRQQVTVQESDMAATRSQIAQAAAQKNQAQTQLGYTKVFAPLDGIVSVRVARQGEVVQAGAPVVTILDVDHLWVQADVEEGYIDQIAFGQKFKVQLQSGDEMEGTVFFKGVENDFATQRDVSRTKRDIKTFEIKLSIPNPDRKLFAGMTAYVLLPTPPSERRGFHFY
jgi:HlyD family secretion protein